MPKDNVAEHDRAAFESMFLETQSALVRRMTNEGLPNEVLETIVGRLIAYRAAITREDVAAVIVRVLEIANGHEEEARRAIALARLITGDRP